MKKLLLLCLLFVCFPTVLLAYDNKEILRTAESFVGDQVEDGRAKSKDQSTCFINDIDSCGEYEKDEQGVCQYVMYKECKNFVQYILSELFKIYPEGLSLGRGYTQKGYFDSMAIEISPSVVTAGDIIQTSCDAMDTNERPDDKYIDAGCETEYIDGKLKCKENYRQYCNGYHTAIIKDVSRKESNGDYVYDVVDSNWNSDCVITTHEYNPFAYARKDRASTQKEYCNKCPLSVHIYRFAEVSDETTTGGECSKYPNPSDKVGLFHDCDYDKKYTPLFKDTYDRNGGENQLGVPFDDGGGLYVHGWNKILMQNLKGGSYVPDESILMFCKDNEKVSLIRTGFWAWYRVNNGIEILGSPWMDEQRSDNVSFQYFQKGALIWCHDTSIG